MIVSMIKERSSIIGFLGSSAVFLALAMPVFASNTLCPSGQFNSLCSLKADKVGTVVGTIITTLMILAVIICVFFLLWGGIRWTMSGGDKGKIDQARGTIIAAIVGLVISLLSFFIVNVVLYIITGSGITAMQLPTLY
jgi:small-conductance mechanosensitive channel